MSSGPEWIRPDWPAPDGVRAVFSTRQGPLSGAGVLGASLPPWDHFNLGDHVGDDASAVSSNRKVLQQALNARPVFLQQVHGTEVAHLDPLTPDGTVADAAVTSQSLLACTVMVADCLPVLFTNVSGSVVGAAHAGWRGLATGVIEHTLAALQGQSGCRASDMLAWLGPCIGPDAFEVGSDVLDAFTALDAGASACFRAQPDHKYMADLAALARRRLAQLGVSQIHGNDSSPDWCTVTDSSRFYSYRRDQRALGASGRMAACIWKL